MKLSSNQKQFLISSTFDGRYADTIVTVSNAVANHVKQSRFVKNDQVQVIYNGVDNAVYHEMDASAVRDQFGIAQDALLSEWLVE